MMLNLRFFQSGYMYKMEHKSGSIYRVECLGVGIDQEPPMFDSILECVQWCQNTDQEPLIEKGVFSLYFYELDDDHCANEEKLITATAIWVKQSKGFKVKDYSVVSPLQLGILSQVVREHTLHSLKGLK